MPSLARSVMQTLYGANLWDGFAPERVSEEVQGWNGDHSALQRLTSEHGSRFVVDVGVWKGQSTITLANAMKLSGIDGCVVAVDTFLGSPEHWSCLGGLFSRLNGRPDLYETFLANVHAAGLTDYVVPLPQTSVTAAAVLRHFGIRPEIVHVDAAHEYADVLRDVEEYWGLLAPGGFLIGDDYVQAWPGVVQAAGEFSARVRCPIQVEAPKWILQKPSS